MHIDPGMKLLVENMLKRQLSPNYCFHDFEHTIYVVEKVGEIARHQHCTPYETDLLLVAALWHDTGYISSQDDHENESCRLAGQFLPDFGYSPEDIGAICDLIKATKVPHAPKSKLEEIIADADLAYLGTDLATERAQKLYDEIRAFNPLLTKKQWDAMQIGFLREHVYFTRYCKDNYEKPKQAYLAGVLKSAAADV